MQCLKIAQVIINKHCPVLGNAEKFLFPYFIGIASRQNDNRMWSCYLMQSDGRLWASSGEQRNGIQHGRLEGGPELRNAIQMYKVSAAMFFKKNLHQSFVQWFSHVDQTKIFIKVLVNEYILTCICTLWLVSLTVSTCKQS